MTLTISLPLPDKALSPNARVFWRRKYEAAKAAKEMACHLTTAAIGRRTIPVVTSVTLAAVFYFTTERKRDRDNFAASLKAVGDGIAIALGVNDTLFTWEPPVFAIDKKKPRVEITFTITGAGA